MAWPFWTRCCAGQARSRSIIFFFASVLDRQLLCHIPQMLNYLWPVPSLVFATDVDILALGEHRTGVINQIRAFLLERGIAVRQGLRFLRSELPRLLTTPAG